MPVCLHAQLAKLKRYLWMPNKILIKSIALNSERMLVEFSLNYFPLESIRLENLFKATFFGNLHELTMFLLRKYWECLF